MSHHGLLLALGRQNLAADGYGLAETLRANLFSHNAGGLSLLGCNHNLTCMLLVRSSVFVMPMAATGSQQQHGSATGTYLQKIISHG
jgi:hypothetical protein